MAKVEKAQLKWLAIDPTTLNAEGAKLHTALRAQFEATKKAKEAFEASLAKQIFGADGIPAGKTMAVAYRRGIAVALDNAKAEGAGKGAAGISAIAAKLVA